VLLSSGLNDCCWSFIRTVDTLNIVSINSVICACSALYVIGCLFTICALCHYQTHFRERFSVCLSAEFVHRVRCAFELIMLREDILSIPGVQLTADDCAWCISQLLT